MGEKKIVIYCSGENLSKIVSSFLSLKVLDCDLVARRENFI